MSRAAGAIAAVVLAAAVVAAAPVPAAAAGPCAGDAVWVVVDFGDGRAPSSACVAVGGRATGVDVLSARAAQLGVPRPDYAPSGFLCGIDGVTPAGCLQPGAPFWSYWLGGCGGWDYAAVGPASRRARPDVAEAWRLQPAGAAEGDNPPATAALCGAGGAPVGGSGGGAGSGAGSGGDDGAAGAGAGASGTGGPAGAADVGAAGAGVPGVGAADADGAGDDAAGVGPADGGASSTTIAGRAAAITPGAARAAAARPTAGSGNGSIVGLLAGLVVLGALGGAGVVIARRRGAAGTGAG